MSQISSLLPPENVILYLEAISKKTVFEHASLVFENNQGIARSAVFDSLFAREKLGSTGLGRGIAIPHGRIKGLEEAKSAFIRLATPVPFDSPDGKPAVIMYFLLVPEEATEQHLQMLSNLTERFSDNTFRDSLLKAKSAEIICQLFNP